MALGWQVNMAYQFIMKLSDFLYSNDWAYWVLWMMGLIFILVALWYGTKKDS
jgi:type II secretory pathway component PulF